MAILSNSPTFTYVSYRGMCVTYEGTMYTVQNGYSNKKYLYWEKSSPYQLTESNVKLAETGNRFLVIVNDNGLPTIMPQEELVITFDGENPDLVAEKIFGIYEKNKEFGNKFTTIEETIEGIKQTVGETENIEGTIVEKISKLEQTSSDISASVSKVDKEFRESESNNELREKLNKSIVELNATLGIFKSSFNAIAKNSQIEEEDRVEINSHIEILTNRKATMLVEVDKVLTLMSEGGFTDKYNSLNSAKQVTVSSLDNLVTIITTAISDNNLVPSEITTIINGFGNCNVSINKLKNSCDECIFLGAGGSVSEELARLDMKSDEIVLSVSTIETGLKNNLSVDKAQVQEKITGALNALKNLNNTTNKTFEDGGVSTGEIEVVNQAFEKLIIEKNNLSTLYTTYYTSPYISVSVKTSLKSVYDAYITTHSSLKSKLDTVMSDGFVNDAEKIQVDTAYKLYESGVNQLHKGFTMALDDIEINRNNYKIQEAKKELRQEIDDVDSKVNDLDDVMNTTFKNNVIDEAEKKAISLNLQNLEKEKVDIDTQYSHLYNNKFLTGNLKVDYKTSYDTFVSKYNSLITTLNGILNKKELISDTDRNNMNAGYTQLNTALASFMTFSNKVLENVALKEAEAVKIVLGQNIKDVDDKVDDLDNTMNSVFKNSVLDESERKAISLNLQNLEKEKVDIDNQYAQLYKSINLDGQLKVDYKTSYDNYISKYNSLVNVINGILNKEELINEADRANMNNANLVFATAIGNFVKKSNEVIEYIAKKEAEAVSNSLNSSISDLNDKVDGILDDVGGAIADGILDDAERISISQNLKILESQKADLYNQYKALYDNPKLIGSAKANLKTSYDEYETAYSNLVSAINNILEKVGDIEALDREQLDIAFSAHTEKLGVLTKSLVIAVDSVTNKVVEDAKTELNREISDLSGALGDLEETMNGAFKDGILSEAEKKAIRQNLKVLETEKQDIDSSYVTVYNNSKLTDSAKTNLKTSYDNYISKYNGLVNTINTILNKTGILDNSDQTLLDNAFTAHKTALGDFTTKYNVAIDSITTKSVEDAKKALQQEIRDVSGAISDLEETMEGVFKDGVLSEAEKLAIKQNLQTLSNEKADIDKQYTTVYSNVDLTGTPKTNLKTAYDNYISKYNSLVNIINGILNKTGLIDSADQTSLNNAFTAHRTALGTYSTRVSEAIDAIAKKKSDTALSDSKTYTDSAIKIAKDSITQTVEKIEEKVTITSDKIDNLQIGGRNYLKDTKDKINITGLNSANQTVKIGTTFSDYSLIVGKQITTKFKYKITSSTASGTMYAQTASVSYEPIVDSVNLNNIPKEGYLSKTYTLLEGKANTMVRLRFDNFVGTIEISEFKIELGNKATDWTPAPEDIEGKVTTIETWKKTAEQQLTLDGLKTIIGSTYTTSSDVDGIITEKGYQTASQVEQTVNKWEVKFSESGGYNLLYNGDFKKHEVDDIDNWTSDYGGGSFGWLWDKGLGCPNGYGVYSKGALNVAKVLRQNNVPLDPNAKSHTFSYWIHTSSSGADGTTNPFRKIELSIQYTDGTWSYHNGGVTENKFDTWQKVVFTINKPSGKGFKVANVGIWVRDTTKTVHFSQIMLEKGQVATEWSPNPNEISDGITSITKNGIKIEMQDGEGSQGYSEVTHDGFSIYDDKGRRKAWFGQNDTSYIQVLQADDIVCSKVIKNSRGRPTTFYVSANPPSGSNQSGTSTSNACNSIGGLIDKIKKGYGQYNDWQDINIEVAKGDYYESVSIMGLLGSGIIRIKMADGVRVFGDWKVYDNTMMVYLTGTKTNLTTNNGASLIKVSEDTSDGCVYVRNTFCMIENIRSYNKCRPIGTAKYGSYFVASQGGRVYIRNCDISRYSYIVYANKVSQAGIYSCQGYCDMVAASREGSYVKMANPVPSFLRASWADTSGTIVESTNKSVSIYDPNYESAPPPAPPAPTPTVFKQSFTVANLRTVTEGSGSATSGRSGEIGQGKWGSYKPHRGWGDIPGALRTFCSGGSNISMTLTMTRINTSHGYAGDVPSPKFVYSGGTWNSGTKFSRGATKTLTLPSAMVNQIANGTITNIQMWAGTSTDDYSFYNNLTINVTVTKNV